MKDDPDDEENENQTMEEKYIFETSAYMCR